ncbi:MAG: membrane-bound lytic murein transglycosylase MltF [Desulfobacteraceae bacterium]|nr:membrane-bound lytic murein transglycosylase MltF [Desulfobacteraceae bacterium]
MMFYRLCGYICFWVIILCGLGLLLFACNNPLIKNDLEAIVSSSELVMITRNNSTCYYEGPHGPTGFEYELAKAFADYLGVNLKPIIIEEEAEMVTALRAGKADIIAAGLPFGYQSARLLALGPGYLQITQQLVGHRGGPELNTFSDVKNKLIWTTGSSARLDLLKKQKKDHPELNWQTLLDYSAEELLEMVWIQKLPLAIVESNILKRNQRFFPELVVHFDIGYSQHLSWATAPANRHLLAALNKWFALDSTQDRIAGLTGHYYGHLENFDYVDLARYRRRIKNRLPIYQEHFEKAALKYNLDWRIMAALSYQESHWNPKAKSPTGVRGIMMLTLDTAKTLGLKNRLAPEPSIYAGTRYFARLHRMVGNDVPEPDRTLMAMASYNLGFGHLKDARKLAKRMSKPHHTWHGVRSVLPLLQQKKYYKTLDSGYARGNEAVQYVDRIRTYQSILNMAMAYSILSGYGS